MPRFSLSGYDSSQFGRNNTSHIDIGHHRDWLLLKSFGELWRETAALTR
jgi:hypothetical protein